VFLSVLAVTSCLLASDRPTSPITTVNTITRGR
jgi:hypothetical protein